MIWQSGGSDVNADPFQTMEVLYTKLCCIYLPREAKRRLLSWYNCTWYSVNVAKHKCPEEGTRWLFLIPENPI